MAAPVSSPQIGDEPLFLSCGSASASRGSARLPSWPGRWWRLWSSSRGRIGQSLSLRVGAVVASM